MSSRVRSISRLLYKQKDGSKCDMPKTSKVTGNVKISVGDAALGPARGDVAIRKKSDQSWRYPGGVIQRYPSTTINGREYFDHARESDEPGKRLARRKIESNFFITLNTNRTLKKLDPITAHKGKAAVGATLKQLATDAELCKYLKFGPKSDNYKEDQYDDVIQSVDWNSAVETGEKLERLHCHIWLTVHHYSQVQVNMPMMQRRFKALYNAEVAKTPHSQELQINKQPYIQVKLLPTSDWAEVIKQYIHKAMGSSEV